MKTKKVVGYVYLIILALLLSSMTVTFLQIALTPPLNLLHLWKLSNGDINVLILALIVSNTGVITVIVLAWFLAYVVPHIAEAIEKIVEMIREGEE